MTDVNELAGLPTGGPASLPAVKVQLGIAADDERDHARLEPIVDSVNALVRRWPVSEAAVDLEGDPDRAWPGNIVHGAVMLSARLWRRKDTPGGVEAFTQLGAAYVMRSDPDVAMLLKLGSWQAPGIG